MQVAVYVSEIWKDRGVSKLCTRRPRISTYRVGVEVRLVPKVASNASKRKLEMNVVLLFFEFDVVRHANLFMRKI